MMPHSEPNTEAVRVHIVTSTHQFQGNIYVSKAIKDDRRLTNLLSGDKKFLAMTDVEVTDRLTNKVDHQRYPYIQINLAQIEFVKPMG